MSAMLPFSRQVLWPYLLEFVTPIQFTNALAPLCKSLMYLAMKKQEEGENASLIRYDLNGQYWPPPADTGVHKLGTRLQVAGLLRGRWVGRAVLCLFSLLFVANLPSPYALTTRLLVSGLETELFLSLVTGTSEESTLPSPVLDGLRGACTEPGPANRQGECPVLPCCSRQRRLYPEPSCTSWVGCSPIPLAHRNVSVWVVKAQIPS